MEEDAADVYKYTGTLFVRANSRMSCSGSAVEVALERP
jgi:hypothetical protein